MTASSPARIAMIGAGWWATTTQIPAVQEHPDAVEHEPVRQVGDRLHDEERHSHDGDERRHRLAPSRSGAQGAGSSSVSWRTQSNRTAVISVKPKK